MRKPLFLSLLVVLSLYLHAQKADRKILLSLREGENLVYGENCFQLEALQTHYHLVTTMEGKFFVYTNGQRTGPFTELSDDQLPGCPGMGDQQCAVFDPGQCPNGNTMSKYVQYDENYQLVIRFNGKTFGPYMTVIQFVTTCDEKKFAAVALTLENKIVLIHSSGKILPCEGMVSWLKLSANGDQCLAACVKALDPTKMDAAAIDLNELSKFILMDLEGNTFGPFDSNTLSESDIWFCKSSGSHWFMKNGEALLRDGKSWKSFQTAPSPCSVWINEQGNRVIITDFGDDLNAGLSEVSHVSNALEIKYTHVNGKPLLTWISLENQKDLVLYQMAL